MNSVVVLIFSILWFVLAYKWYGKKLEKRLIQPNDQRATPAVEFNDGMDYYPSKPVMLFGHHFSSVAGAGPILGPIAAFAAFGWAGTLLWILFGTIFIGGVHDYLSLMLSVRFKGDSLPEIAQEAIGRRARNLFSVFVLLTIILVVGVFGFVAAKTLASTPSVVIPTFGIIPIAMLFGFMIYKLDFSTILGTIIALAGLFCLIWLGYEYPISLPFSSQANFGIWFVLLMGYGLIASVLPVWMLLQPRDYISNWILVIGMALGFLGIFVTHPTVNAPALTSLNSASGPIWPTICIVVACGAISGFHSIIASGTTSKQLAKESDGRLIGYGTMLTEGLLAVIALLAVSAGLFWDAPVGMEKFGFLSVLNSGGPIKAFGLGYGRLVEPFIGTFGMLFGITMLKTFVMTTLDTCIRLGRMISAELVGPKVPLLKNKFAGSIFIAIPAFFVGYTGTYNIIWPIFGAANQLIGALSLLVITAYLVGVKKPTKYTLYPAIFMVITTIASLLYQGYNFLVKSNPDYILGGTAIVLIVLAVVVADEARKIVTQGKGDNLEVELQS
ncbi:carbon starvation protein CstA [Orenia metallireducens]|uniref:Carbon starvation protein CstA n=1 Tax=Orenia metallireducens TaxID=1413210 RepID=A0A1C0AAA3_9FIRM|nr:carbon starvation protein A [Orenia metallireducens]OCL27206.1 carbon starvation protein CstA [Orenia metallireducens]